MNREIIFRAKSTTGEWLTGYYVKLAGFDYIVPFNSAFRHILDADFEDAFEEVDVETLQEWTGLKDIDGVEIYEGDIIKQQNFNGEEYTAIYQVCYDLGSFCLQLVKGNAKAMKDSGYSSWSFELYAEDKGKIRKGQVIGNIHDNPEILK